MLRQKGKRSEDWSPGECAAQVWSCHSGLMVSQMYWYTTFALPSLLLAPVPSVHYYHSCYSSAPIPQSSPILCSQVQHPFQVTDLPLDLAPLPLQPHLPPFLAPGDLQVYWAACSSLTSFMPLPLGTSSSLLREAVSPTPVPNRVLLNLHSSSGKPGHSTTPKLS